MTYSLTFVTAATNKSSVLVCTIWQDSSSPTKVPTHFICVSIGSTLHSILRHCHFEQYKIVTGVVIGGSPVAKLKIVKIFPGTFLWDLWNLCLWKFSTIWYSWGTYFLCVSIIPILWLMSLNVIVRITHTYVNTCEWWWEVWMEMDLPPCYRARVRKQTEKVAASEDSTTKERGHSPLERNKEYR